MVTIDEGQDSREIAKKFKVRPNFDQRLHPMNQLLSPKNPILGSFDMSLNSFCIYCYTVGPGCFGPVGTYDF